MLFGNQHSNASPAAMRLTVQTMFLDRNHRGASAARPKALQMDGSTTPTVDNSTSQTNGLLRLSEILAPGGPIPVSRSTWWAGVKTGRYPQPVKLGPRITAWRTEDIRSLVDDGAV